MHYSGILWYSSLPAIDFLLTTTFPRCQYFCHVIGEEGMMDTGQSASPEKKEQDKKNPNNLISSAFSMCMSRETCADVVM